MVQLSQRQKKWLKIGSIIVLALGIIVLILISRAKQDDVGDVPGTAVTPTSGPVPTLAAPPTDADGNPPPDMILIKDFSFRPPVLRVKAGTTVTIVNADAAGHSVSSNEMLFDTGILRENERGTLTFTTPGTYSYRCRKHPAMNASIVVTP